MVVCYAALRRGLNLARFAPEHWQQDWIQTGCHAAWHESLPVRLHSAHGHHAAAETLLQGGPLQLNQSQPLRPGRADLFSSTKRRTMPCVQLLQPRHLTSLSAGQPPSAQGTMSPDQLCCVVQDILFRKAGPHILVETCGVALLCACNYKGPPPVCLCCRQGTHTPAKLSVVAPSCFLQRTDQLSVSVLCLHITCQLPVCL